MLGSTQFKWIYLIWHFKLTFISLVAFWATCNSMAPWQHFCFFIFLNVVLGLCTTISKSNVFPRILNCVSLVFLPSQTGPLSHNFAVTLALPRNKDRLLYFPSKIMFMKSYQEEYSFIGINTLFGPWATSHLLDPKLRVSHHATCLWPPCLPPSGRIQTPKRACGQA